jgi:hypothetical protein
LSLTGNYFNNVKVSSAIYADSAGTYGGTINPSQINAGDLPTNVLATSIKTGNYLNDIKVSSAIYSENSNTSSHLTTGNYLNDVKVSSAIYATSAGSVGGNINTNQINAGDLPSNVFATAIKTGTYFNDVKVSSSIYSTNSGTANNSLNLGGIPAASYALTSGGIVTTAHHLFGGTAGSIPYQNATSSTSMLAPGDAGKVFVSNGTNAPVWTNQSALNVGNAAVSASCSGNAATATVASSCSGNAATATLATSAATCTGNSLTASNLANGTYSYGSGNIIVNANTANTAAAAVGSGNLQLTGAGDHYLQNGNVGIGTTSPGNKLELLGLGTADGIYFNGHTQVKILTTADNGLDSLSFNAQRTGKSIGIYLNDYSGESFAIGKYNGSYCTLYSPDSRNLILQEVGGNVGIGTTDPTATLYVNGTSTVTSNMHVGGNLTVNGAVTMAGSKFFSGNFTHNMTAASGTQSITGVGFKPSAVSFSFCIPTVQPGTGFDDGVNKNCTCYKYGSWETYGSAIFMEPVSVGNYQTAYISSFDADGFTLTWTKAGSPPSGTLYATFMAYR